MSNTILSLDLISGDKQSVNITECQVEKNFSGNLYLAYQNKKKTRQVFSSTKCRSDFTSGGSKPFRQKGTGRARAGTSRSPLKVGGAVIFGPKYRNVKRKTNSKLMSSTLQQLLALYIDRSEIFQNIECIKKVKDILPRLNLSCSYLCIIDTTNPNDIHFFTKVKNIPNLYFNSANSLCIEDVLRVDNIIYTPNTFSKIFNSKERLDD
ncbi:MAG: 50S ribosomal protein L4 [Candidatus Margulisbacteria bacterium]|nr:50S ribosomal protein L4 [Candidatus Margulisiibacteriota bacterium]